jgi:hypothetical protein
MEPSMALMRLVRMLLRGVSPAAVIVGAIMWLGPSAGDARAQDAPLFVFDVQVVQRTPLRVQPDPRAAPVALLEEGDVVTVIARERGTDGVLWFGVAGGPGAIVGWLPPRSVVIIQLIEYPN